MDEITVSVATRFSWWERLTPAWLGRRLGWQTCVLCNKTRPDVHKVSGDGRVLCNHCWAIHVYFPMFKARKPDE